MDVVPAKAKPTFGLSMIVKDGSHMLYRILDMISPETCPTPFDQVVILDTGSTDGTVQMLKEKYPWVEVHEAKWEFNFSIARNQALSYMTTDTWMWLDADDTFTQATLETWHKIAKKLWDRRDEPEHPVYGLVPYIYEVDKNDFPVVVHFRERIMLGTTNWEWREPLHEVCYYTQPDGYFDAFNDCPVVHRPLGDNVASVNGDRNWKILVHNYVHGDRSDRTLYYMGRSAVMKGYWEFALDIATQLLERAPGGYYEYEAALAVGDAWAGLYRRDKTPEYKASAIMYYTKAKRFEPTRNDARARICDLYITDGEGALALIEAQGMNENMPATVATTLPAYYGKYKYSVMALIHFRLTGNFWHALVNHMQALDCPKPHESSFELDKAIRQYLEDQEIGIIYCDEKYNGQAMIARNYLLERGTFKEVYLFNNPHCIAYASNCYFHFTEKESTLYQEDGHPRLRKFLFSAVDIKETPYGYDCWTHMPTTPQLLRDAIDEMLTPTSVVEAANISEGLEKVKAVRSEKAIIAFVNDNVLGMTHHDEHKPTQRNKIRIYHRSTGEIVGISGYTENICALYVDRKGILRVPSKDSCETVLIESQGGHAIRIEDFEDNGKKVVIVAPGIESWDGTTPRRWGIGASESCVIYMSEALRQRGYNVTVYNPTTKGKVVAGVTYIPHQNYQYDHKPADLFVASRVPEALSGPRKGKVQVLWMHDIAEAYLHRLNNEQTIDRFIVISEWQAARAAECNFKQSKFKLIPNGIINAIDEDIARVSNRTIWVSQPERGLENLHRMWEKEPELFSDVWVVYGFYNLLNYQKGNNFEQFMDTCRFKYALRQMKAKIVGRIPHSDVQTLMQTAARWVYPSKFPETFCVAGLEALNNGVRCFFTSNGATQETLTRVSVSAGRAIPLEASSPEGFEFDRDADRWLEAIKNNQGLNFEKGLENPHYYWDRVTDEWENLINVS